MGSTAGTGPGWIVPGGGSSAAARLAAAADQASLRNLSWARGAYWGVPLGGASGGPKWDGDRRPEWKRQRTFALGLLEPSESPSWDYEDPIAGGGTPGDDPQGPGGDGARPKVEVELGGIGSASERSGSVRGSALHLHSRRTLEPQQREMVLGILRNLARGAMADLPQLSESAVEVARAVIGHRVSVSDSVLSVIHGAKAAAQHLSQPTTNFVSGMHTVGDQSVARGLLDGGFRLAPGTGDGSSGGRETFDMGRSVAEASSQGGGGGGPALGVPGADGSYQFHLTGGVTQNTAGAASNAHASRAEAGTGDVDNSSGVHLDALATLGASGRNVGGASARYGIMGKRISALSRAHDALVTLGRVCEVVGVQGFRLAGGSGGAAFGSGAGGGTPGAGGKDAHAPPGPLVSVGAQGSSPSVPIAGDWNEGAGGSVSGFSTRSDKPGIPGPSLMQRSPSSDVRVGVDQLRFGACVSRGGGLSAHAPPSVMTALAAGGADAVATSGRLADSLGFALPGRTSWQGVPPSVQAVMRGLAAAGDGGAMLLLQAAAASAGLAAPIGGGQSGDGVT